MDIAKQSARGSAVLFGGNLLATIIAAAASVVVARLLGPEDYGLFALSVVTPALLQFLTHFGTRTAVTKYVANYLALGDEERARRFAQSAMIFSVAAGTAFAVVNYLASGWVAVSLFHRPELQPYIALASIYLFGQSIVLTVIATATGWNAMGQASFANILQSALKLAISPALILLGFGVTGAVLGHSLSYAMGGLLSAALLYVTKVKFARERLGHLVEDTRELIRFGFPPFVGALLGGVSTFYVTVLLALVAGNAVVGYYQAANNLVIPATLLSAATTTALYPAFSSLHATRADTGSALSMSVRYVGFLVLPILFFLAAASKEMMYVFYGSSFAAGSVYLVMLALSNAPVLVGQSVFVNFFNGVGKPGFAFYVASLSAAVLFAAAPLLSVFYGLAVPGLIYALFASNLALVAGGIYLVRRGGLGSTPWRAALATLGASLVALLACAALPSFGDHVVVALAVKLVLFGGVYLTLAPLLGALGEADVDRLGESLRGVTLVGKAVSPFLQYEKALARIARRTAKRD